MVQIDFRISPRALEPGTLTENPTLTLDGYSRLREIRRALHRFKATAQRAILPNDALETLNVAGRIKWNSFSVAERDLRVKGYAPARTCVRRAIVCTNEHVFKLSTAVRP